MNNGNNGGFNDQQYGGQDYNFPPQMAFDGSPGRGIVQLIFRHQIPCKSYLTYLSQCRSES
jgi:hypothetical protein